MFSIIVYISITFKASSDVLVNYYQDTLYNLTSNFDYKITQEFLKNPSRNGSNFKYIKDHLESFVKTLGIEDVYLSSITSEDKKEILLVHGTGEKYKPGDDANSKNEKYKFGDSIDSKIGLEAFKTKKIISRKLRDKKNNPYYSFYSPILNEHGDSIALIAFNIPEQYFENLTLRKFAQTVSLLILFSLIVMIFYSYLATIGLWIILKPIYIIKNEVLNISSKIFSINKNINFSTYEFNNIQILFVKTINLIKDFIMSLIIYLEYIRFSISKVKLSSLEIVNKIKSTITFINKVSKSSESVNDEVHNLKDKIQIFSDEIKAIRDELKKILEINLLSTNTCQDNNEFLNEFLIEISILIKKFRIEQSECQNLTYLSNKINHILENILTITNETKLLSLNASIVAISAGEHGKSFGVIAKEVGDLSQNIIKSANYIQQTLIKITETISVLNKESIEIFESFKTHSEKSKIFSSNLNEIYSSIKNINSFLKDISFSSDKLNTKNLVILDNVTFLSSTSSSNLNSIKQIENLITKVNETALTFRQSFEDLDFSINKIKLDLNQFKL